MTLDDRDLIAPPMASTATAIPREALPRTSGPNTSGLVAMALEPRVLLDAAAVDAVAEATSDGGSDGSADDGGATETDAVAEALSEHVPPSTDSESDGEAGSGGQIVFIDAAVDDPDVIAAAVSDGVEVVTIPSGVDALSYMADVLSSRSDLSAIHLVTHGFSGVLEFDSGSLSIDDLDSRAADLATLGASLAEGGDLLLYGCDVGMGSSGLAFMERLAELTGADVAASTDGTGAESQGGDWVLEAMSGTVESAIAFEPTIAGYEGLLASIPSGTIVTFDGMSVDGSYSTGTTSLDSQGFNFSWDYDTNSTQSEDLYQSLQGDTSTGDTLNSDAYALALQNYTFSPVEDLTQSLTITYAADSTAEFDFQSFFDRSYQSADGYGIDVVYGYRDGVLVATYDPTTEIGASYDTTDGATTHTLGSDFDRVDQVVIVSTSKGFVTAVDSFVMAVAPSAPVIANLDGDVLAYTENGGAADLDQGTAVSITDADSADFNGGNLTVAVTGATADEDLTINTSGTVSLSAGVTVGSVVSVGGNAIGTITTDGQDGSDLVITFNSANATPSAVSTLSSAIQYTNTSDDPTATRSVVFSVNDGDGVTSDTATVTVNITAVNDAGAIANIHGDSFTYTEGDGAVTLDQGTAVTVTDADSSDYNGGKLDVGVAGQTANEDLTFATGTGVTVTGGYVFGATVSVDGNVVGTLETTGQNGARLTVRFTTADATPAAVAKLIAAAQYSNDSQDISGSRSVSIWITESDNTLSNIAGVTINLQGVADAPEIADLNGDSFTYTEGDGAQTLDQGTGLDITDVDSADFDGGALTVAVTSGTADEDLTIDTSGTVSLSAGMTVGSVVSVSGSAIGTITTDGQDGSSLVITFNSANATPTAVTTLAAAIQYTNGSADPSGTRSVTFDLTDGDGGTATTSTVSVTLAAVVDNPVVSNLDGDVLAYTENAGALTLDQGTAVSIADADSTDFNGGALTVAVTGGTADEDLTIDTSGTVSLSAGMTAGSVVSVSGSAIGTITTDGQDGASLVITFNSANATPAAVSTLAAAIRYTNGSETPSGSRSVTFDLTDGDGGTASTSTVTVNLTAVDDAPTSTNLNGNSFTYSAGDGAVTLDQGTGVTVSDVDSTDFNGGGLSINAGGGTADESLTIDTSGTVSLSAGMTVGSVVSVGGNAIGTITTDGQSGANLVITFNSANATPATISTLVSAIQYTNTSSAMASSTNVTFTLDDGDGAGGVSIGTVSVDLNNKPTISNLDGDTLAYDEGDGAVLLDQGGDAAILDSDTFGIQGGTLTISVAGATADEDLTIDTSGTVSLSAGMTVGSVVSVGGVSFGNVTSDGQDGDSLVISLNGVDSSDTAASTVLKAIQYTNSSNNPSGARTVNVVVTDFEGATSDTASVTVNLTGVADVPVLANLDGDSFTYTEGSGAQTLDQGTGTAITDVDSTDFNGGTLTVAVTGSTSNEDLTIDTSGAVSLSAGMTAGSVVSVSGSAIGTITTDGQDGSSLVITFNSANATPAAVTTLTQAIEYANDSDVPSGARSVTFVLTDGDGGTSTTSTVTVNLSGVNDDPQLANLDGTPSYTEEGSAVILDSDVSVSDAELDAAADYAGASLTIARNGGANANDSFSFSGGTFTVSGSNLQSGGLTFATFTNAGGTLTISFTSSGTTATGTLVNEVMRAIAYSNGSNTPASSVQLDWTFSDGNSGAQGSGGAGSDSGSTTVSITDVNDAPTLSTTASDPGYTEGGGVTGFFGAATPDTVESGQTFTAMTLTLTNISDGSDELLTIDGSEIALTNGNTATTATNGLGVSVSLSGGTATVTFSGATLSSAALTSLITGLGYRNTSADPTEGARALTITSLTDSGGTANGGVETASLSEASTVTVTAVNDPPTLGGVGDAASQVVAADGATALTDLADVTVGNPDSTDYNGGSLVISQDSGTSNGDWGVDGTTVTSGGDGTFGAGESIVVSGVTIGTVDGTNTGLNGNTLEISLNGNATSALVQSFLRNLTYDAPSGLGDRGFTVTLSDGDGTANGGDQDVSDSFTVSVTPNPPVVSNLDGDRVDAGNGIAVAIDAGGNVTVSDPDSGDFDTGTLTIAKTSGRGGDFSLTGALGTGVSSGTVLGSADGTIAAGETIFVGGVAVATVTENGQGFNNLLLTFNSNATPARVQTLIRDLQYTSTTGGDHTFDLTITDSATDTATSNTSSFTVDVNTPPVNVVPGAQTVLDNTTLSLGGISVLEADGGTLSTTVSVPSGDGTFTVSGGGVTITGNGSNSVTITGNEGNVNSALNNLVYTPPSDSGGVKTITVVTSDGIQSDTDTISVTVTDLPNLANVDGDSQSTTAGTTVALDVGGDAAVTDSDSADLNGGDLSITRVNGLAGDFSVDGVTVTSGGDGTLGVGETISVGGVDIGTVTTDGSGTGNLVIHFNSANATPARIAQLIQGLRYTSSALGAHAFDVRVLESSGEGHAAARATVTVANPASSAPPPSATDDGPAAEPAPSDPPPVVTVHDRGGVPVVVVEPRGEQGGSGPVIFAITPDRTMSGDSLRSIFSAESVGQSPLAQAFAAAANQGGLGISSPGFRALLGNMSVLGALTRVSGLTGDVFVLQGGEWVQIDVLDALQLNDGANPGGGQTAALDGMGLDGMGLGGEAAPATALALVDAPDGDGAVREGAGDAASEPLAPPHFLAELELDLARRDMEAARLARALALHALPEVGAA